MVLGKKNLSIHSHKSKEKGARINEYIENLGNEKKKSSDLFFFLIFPSKPQTDMHPQTQTV